jgi:hypothetical protein
MSAIISALGLILKFLWDKSRTLSGAIAVLTAFSAMTGAVLFFRWQTIHWISLYIPEKGICYMNALGVFRTFDIAYGMYGTAFGVRFTRLMATELQKVMK